MKLEIHHFYDIIRFFGTGEGKMQAHLYGHSLHIIAEEIRENPELKIELCRGCDDVCNNCKHFVDGHCDDFVDHRKDFKMKEEFNHHIDGRILEKCDLKEGDVLTPLELCEKASDYLENMEYVYEGNDAWHTKNRKELVEKGLDYYKKKHS